MNGEVVFTKHRGARNDEDRCTEHLDIDYQVPPCITPPPEPEFSVCNAAFHKKYYSQFDDTTKIASDSCSDPEVTGKHCFRPVKLQSSSTGVAPLQTINVAEHTEAWGYNRCECVECQRGFPEYKRPAENHQCGHGAHTPPSRRGVPEPEAMCPPGMDSSTTAAVWGGDGSSKCYFVNRGINSNLDTGKAWCEAHGGELASIHSSADNQAVIDILRGTSAWIGALGTECPDHRAVCTWTWEDGTEWTHPQDLGIAHDGLNHNNFRLHETRIALHSDRRWHDWVHGQSSKGVVCQRKAIA